jgi:hypothetical protein
MNIRILLLAAAIICFGGVAVFATSMHDPDEVIRVVSLGLAFFAAAFIP